jgi:CspA family cold shock protein
MASPRLSGTVKWFNDEKGYVFIVRDDGERDVFVHFSAIQMPGQPHRHRKLDEHDKVEFDLEETEKGLQAANVLKIEMPAESTNLRSAADPAVLDELLRADDVARLR